MIEHYKVAELHAHPELERLLPTQTPDEYEAMKSDIESSRIFQPLILCRDGDGHVVIDGRHRLRAAVELGHKEVPGTLLDGLSEDERIERGVRLNNRRNMNPEQKRALAAALLKRWPERSDRALATLVGCDHKTVTVVRAELVDGGEIPHHEKRTGKDGVTQPATKPARTGCTVNRKPAAAPANGNGNGNGKSRLVLPAGETPESVTRQGLALEEDGQGQGEVAVSLGIHPRTYTQLKSIVRLADDPNLKTVQRAAAICALDAVNSGGSINDAYESVRGLAEAKFGSGTATNGANMDRRFEIRAAAVERAVLAAVATCDALAQVDVPAGLPADRRARWLDELEAAVGNLRTFRGRVKEA